MAKQDDNSPQEPTDGNQPPSDSNAPHEGRQVQVRVDERDMQTSYANAFRTNATPEEVMIDFGVNLPEPQQQSGDRRQVVFRLNNRIIMNYYSAKRLAMTLADLIRRHEQQYGELELDVAKRRKDQM
ncbi:MAG: DUF3467 domain-containing protein [Phycisphaerae bacterium]